MYTEFVSQHGNYTVVAQYEGRHLDYLVQNADGVLSVFPADRAPTVAKYRAQAFARELHEQERRDMGAPVDERGLFTFEDVVQARHNGTLPARLAAMTDVDLIRLAHVHARGLVERALAHASEFTALIARLLGVYREVIHNAGLTVCYQED